MRPTLSDIRAAAARIEPYIHRTPSLTSRTLGFSMKAENLQKGGAFKVRGALNRLLSLDPAVRERGVVAFSSGNHAQGVAIAARLLGVPAVIVMPADSMAHKVAATRGYGAEIVSEGVDVHSRDSVARGIAEQRNMTLVPPFDDPFVIAGQGTVGLELVEQNPDVEQVVVPLGGGGLLAGVALAVKCLRPSARIVGVEPKAGDDGQRSFREGRRVALDAPPATIADGARTLCVGALNFDLITQYVDEVVTVDDEALLDAVWLLASRVKTVVEPTGALGAAAVLGGLVSSDRATTVVLSGGNIGPAVMAQAAARAAAAQ